MNPYRDIINDLNLNHNSLGDWSWLHAWLEAMSLSWDGSVPFQNPYRHVLNTLPIEGHFQQRARQLLMPGLLAWRTT